MKDSRRTSVFTVVRTTCLKALPRVMLPLGCLFLASTPQAHAAQAQPAAQTLGGLSQDINRVLLSGGVPGAVVVVIEDGQVVLEVSHGVADLATGRATTPDTLFRAGSVSKTFTAMAALALQEDKRLSLQAKVSDLLPEWSHVNVWANTDPVRLVHLLEHTSGLDDVRYRHYLLNSATMPLVQALPAFGPYTARWRPGSGTAYSNAGPVVAGRIIEVASGSDFASFVTTRLTAPLGMVSARWTRTDDMAARLASSYGSDGRTPEPFVDTPARPSGSLNISPRDLARLPQVLLGRGMLDGVRVLQAGSVERMETSSSGATAGLAIPMLGWGLGLKADVNGRAVFFGHEGSIDGFTAAFAYAPTLNAGYVVMSNSLSDAATAVASMVRAYLERNASAPPAVNVPMDPEQLAAWAGQYQSVTPRQELLRAIIGLTQWEGAQFDGSVLRYGKQRWRHEGHGVFRAEGAAAPGLVFRRASHDHAKGDMQAYMHHGTRRRVAGWEMAVKAGSLGLLALVLPVSVAMVVVWLRAALGGAPRALAARGVEARRARNETPSVASRTPKAGPGAQQAIPEDAAFSHLAAADLRTPTRLGVLCQQRTWLAVRLLPLFALWATVAVPVGVLALLGTGDLAWLGRPTAAGWALAGLGVLAPVLWFTGAAALLRIPATWPARLHGALHLLLSALLIAWLGAHGWLGLRIWH